jgi:hypothetical protein
MSHAKTGNGIGQIVKALVVTFFRLLALAISFVCKIAGLILIKISELMEKLSGHGHH